MGADVEPDRRRSRSPHDRARVPRLAGRRLEGVLLVVGAALMAVGSAMPWLEGPTKTIGYVRWTGFDDTGEGAMLVFTALGLIGWVRWREDLLGIEGRARWLPLILAVASLLLWVIAFRKAIALSYFEIAAGARPQLGLLVAGLGALVSVGGALLALRESAATTDGPRRDRLDGGLRPHPRPAAGGPEGYRAQGRVERRPGSGYDPARRSSAPGDATPRGD